MFARFRFMFRKAREYFPGSRHLQRQWVAKTQWLEQTGKHARFTGGWKMEGAEK